MIYGCSACPTAWKSPSSTSKAQIPSDVTRLAMFLIMPSATASATLPPRGRGGPLDPKGFFRGHCEGVLDPIVRRVVLLTFRR